MMHPTAWDEHSITRTKELLLAINSDRQNALQPVDDFVCLPMVVGRPVRGRRME